MSYILSDLNVDVLRTLAARKIADGAENETALEIYEKGLRDGQQILAESLLENLKLVEESD